MHFVLGMGNAEIAEVLETNANAVGVMLHRGRAELQRLMEEGG